MKIKEISKKQINLEVKNRVNEGSTWNWLFGSSDSYENYSKELESIIDSMVSTTYYDKNLSSRIRTLYNDIRNSKIDRRDKQELLRLMFDMYQTMEFSRQKLEGITRKIQRLR